MRKAPSSCSVREDTSGYCHCSAVVPSHQCFFIPKNTIIEGGLDGVHKLRPEEIITTWQKKMIVFCGAGQSHVSDTNVMAIWPLASRAKVTCLCVNYFAMDLSQWRRTPCNKILERACQPLHTRLNALHCCVHTAVFVLQLSFVLLDFVSDI